MKTHECDICGKIYSKKASLKKHVPTHSQNNAIKCNECCYTFSSLVLLKQHQNKHHKNQFRCYFCSEGFHHQDDMALHVALGNCLMVCGEGHSFLKYLEQETSNPLLQCCICGQKFEHQVDLDKHLAWHTMSNRLWVCDTCEECFVDAQTLETHKLKHTSKPPNQTVINGLTPDHSALKNNAMQANSLHNWSNQTLNHIQNTSMIVENCNNTLPTSNLIAKQINPIQASGNAIVAPTTSENTTKQNTALHEQSNPTLTINKHQLPVNHSSMSNSISGALSPHLMHAVHQTTSNAIHQIQQKSFHHNVKSPFTHPLFPQAEMINQSITSPRPTKSPSHNHSKQSIELSKLIDKNHQPLSLNSQRDESPQIKQLDHTPNDMSQKYICANNNHQMNEKSVDIEDSASLKQDSGQMEIHSKIKIEDTEQPDVFESNCTSTVHNIINIEPSKSVTSDENNVEEKMDFEIKQEKVDVKIEKEDDENANLQTDSKPLLPNQYAKEEKKESVQSLVKESEEKNNMIKQYMYHNMPESPFKSSGSSQNDLIKTNSIVSSYSSFSPQTSLQRDVLTQQSNSSQSNIPVLSNTSSVQSNIPLLQSNTQLLQNNTPLLQSNTKSLQCTTPTLQTNMPFIPTPTPKPSLQLSQSSNTMTSHAPKPSSVTKSLPAPKPTLLQSNGIITPTPQPSVVKLVTSSTLPINEITTSDDSNQSVMKNSPATPPPNMTLSNRLSLSQNSPPVYETLKSPSYFTMKSPQSNETYKSESDAGRGTYKSEMDTGRSSVSSTSSSSQPTEACSPQTSANLHDRPYECDICQKRFKGKFHLKRHKDTHSGVKPHVCSICGKGFSRTDHLKQHVLRHERAAKKAQLKDAKSNESKSDSTMDSDVHNLIDMDTGNAVNDLTLMDINGDNIEDLSVYRLTNIEHFQ